MKTLVTTVNALRELATGTSPEAIGSILTLHLEQINAVDYLISNADRIDAQRVIVLRDDDQIDLCVPDILNPYRREVLSRIALFSERARAMPIRLPRQWLPYKHSNLVSFYAVPVRDSHSSRWIAETLSGLECDVVFWELTTSNNKKLLESFSANHKGVNLPSRIAWESAFEKARSAFDMLKCASIEPGSDIDLRGISDAASNLTYDQWLEKLGDEQRGFVDAPVVRSIRLRGPAGSGKSLALVLKAVGEAIKAHSSGVSLRVGLITHSWAIASQTDSLVQSMGAGYLSEHLDIFPLLEVAKNLSPAYTDDDQFELWGDDSLSGKQAELDQVNEVIDDFVDSDWITYKVDISQALRDRFDSDSIDVRLGLAWDLLIEFGSVIGAARIFPGVGSESRYLDLDRASWMLALPTKRDRRLVFRIYERYMEALDERLKMTTDQLLSDFLNYLETHAWNRARKGRGYDLLFVDEFHLFSPLERQVLHYLTKDASEYPKIFMAVDPRQSPSEAFIGIASSEVSTRSRSALEDASTDTDSGDYSNYELTTVHRFSPQILELVRHIHHEFPTYELGDDWAVDFSRVESAAETGRVPEVVRCGSRGAEETDVYRAVLAMYHQHRIGIAIVNHRQWSRWSHFAGRLAASKKYHVSVISGRSDIESVGYRKHGVVIGPAEYLAGLQFDVVFVAGVPSMAPEETTVNDRRRLLSLLYLAISRAERDVRIFTNDDDGGLPGVLLRAVELGLVCLTRGHDA